MLKFLDEFLQGGNGGGNKAMPESYGNFTIRALLILATPVKKNRKDTQTHENDFSVLLHDFHPNLKGKNSEPGVAFGCWPELIDRPVAGNHPQKMNRVSLKSGFGPGNRFIRSRRDLANDDRG